MREQLYILLLGILVTLFQSCSDDASGVYSEESDTELATVNIRVSTRANDGNDTNMDANEGIKALRIIVLDESWKILENWYQEGLGGTDGKTEEQTVTLKLPRTKVRFLAIANEKSMGRSFDTATLMEDKRLDYTQYGLKEIFNRAWDDTPASFPKTADEIIEDGLPMTGVKGASDVVLNPDGDSEGSETSQDYNEVLYQDTGDGPVDLTNKTSVSIEIPLIRCVSKIVVNLTNAMENGLTVTEVKFGSFFADKVYYYAHNPLHLPYNTGLSVWNETINQSVSAGTEKFSLFVGYFYPVSLLNDDPSHNYLIALTTGLATDDFQSFLKKNGEGDVTKIGRNMLVTINCTVNLQGKLDVQTVWKLVVNHWADKGNMSIEFN